MWTRDIRFFHGMRAHNYLLTANSERWTEKFFHELQEDMIVTPEDQQVLPAIRSSNFSN